MASEPSSRRHCPLAKRRDVISTTYLVVSFYGAPTVWFFFPAKRQKKNPTGAPLSQAISLRRNEPFALGRWNYADGQKKLAKDASAEAENETGVGERKKRREKTASLLPPTEPLGKNLPLSSHTTAAINKSTISALTHKLQVRRLRIQFVVNQRQKESWISLDNCGSGLMSISQPHRVCHVLPPKLRLIPSRPSRPY